jgi:heme A synthase
LYWGAASFFFSEGTALLGVHRYAVAVAFATFVLLFLGNLVSTTESGLACPDWPLCEGKFIPPMIDGKQFEHTHRLWASFVGTMTFGLCALLFKHRRGDRLLTRLGVIAAVLVTVQALLGALTVKLKLPWYISSLHLGTAMAFFALTVTIAFLTRQRLETGAPPAERAGLGKLILPVVALCWLQLVAGAVMRHLRGGLACGFDFPLCQGALWPLDGHLGIQVHMVHRALGIIVGLAVLWLGHVLFWRRPQLSLATRVAALVCALAVVAQVCLGVLTVWWSREMVTMAIHSSLGAALFAGLVSVYWLACPLPRSAASAGSPALTPAEAA